MLKHVPATDAMGMEQLLVELTTERDGERLVAELRMNRIAFSNFAQFIDRWDPEVQIHDDLIDGRFHSNTRDPRQPRARRAARVQRQSHVRGRRRPRRTASGFMSRRTMFPAGIETQSAAHRAAAARRGVRRTAPCPPTACSASRAIRC